MAFYELIILVSALVISHSIFLTVVLLRLSSKLPNQILALILFLISLRIGSCLAEIYFENLQYVGTYLGGISMALIGPLFYFYQSSFWNPLKRIEPINFVHFLPAIASVFTFPLIRQESVFIMFLLALLIMIIYVISGLMKFRANDDAKHSDPIKWKWNRYFNLGISGIIILFVGQLFFFDELLYMSIVLGTAIVGYGLSLWAVKFVKLFSEEPSKKHAQSPELQELGQKIEKALSSELIFTDPLLTVRSLAKHLKKPPYLISMAVNSYFKKSFPELLNELRIKKAGQLLMDQNKQHYSIEAIAYESGFNSLSSFYSVFKKVTNKTPLEYRKYYSKEK